MRAPTLFTRLLRAGGVGMGAAGVSAAFFAFRDRYQNPAAQGQPWPWRSLGPPALGALLVLAAPWIARRFRWRDDAPASTPEATIAAPVRLGPAWLLVAVAAAGAILIALLSTTNVFGRTLADDLGMGALAFGAAVPFGVVGFGFARATSADVPDRASLLLAVLRAGGVFGLVCTVAGAGLFFGDLAGFFTVGGHLSGHFVPYFVELVLAPVVWLTWMVLVERAFRDPGAPRAARPRHVLAAVAATMAVSLVAPTAALVEGWRWRTEMYARARAEARVEREERAAQRARSPATGPSAPEVPDFEGILFLDGLPDPDGFARRAWTTTAGFAGFVLVAAVAGRRGRGDARPGR